MSTSSTSRAWQRHIRRAPPRQGTLRGHMYTSHRSTWLRHCRRWAAMLACLVLTGWLCWDARTDHYAGLPINTAGQILGDLLTAGLVAPIAYRRRSRPSGSHRSEAGSRASSTALRHSAITPISVLWPTQAGHTDHVSIDPAEHACPSVTVTVLLDDKAVRVTIGLPHMAEGSCVPSTEAGFLDPAEEETGNPSRIRMLL